MSFIAINVCLVCNAFDTAAIPLSCSLCPPPEDGTDWDDKVAYRLVSLAEKKLQKGLAHAHCSVVQLCVRAAELGDLKEAIKNVWAQHREATTKTKEKLVLTNIQAGPVFGKTAGGVDVHLPLLNIQTSDALRSLQTDVLEAVKKYAVKVGSVDVAKSSFHKSFPCESADTMQWMTDFVEKCTGDNFHPHITLGSSPAPTISDLTYFQETRVPWRECRLVAAQMGNYCSCFELLE